MNKKKIILIILLVVGIVGTLLPVLIPRGQSLYNNILKERAQRFSVTFPPQFSNKPLVEKQMSGTIPVYEIKGWFVEQPAFNPLRSLMSKFFLDTPSGKLVVPVYLGVREGMLFVGTGASADKGRYQITYRTVKTEEAEQMIVPYRPALLRVTITGPARAAQEEVIRAIEAYATGARKALPPAATLMPDTVVML